MRRDVGLRRSRMRSRKAHPSNRVIVAEFTADTRAAAMHIAGNACQLNSHICTGRAEQFHHRLRRSHGGEGTLENCLVLCGRCHTGIVHHHIDWAYRHGLLVRSGNDPARIKPRLTCPVTCTDDHCGQSRHSPLAG